MAQNGYSIFFLLMLAAGLASVVRSVLESWTRIAAALAPEEACPIPPVYSTRVLPAAQVPWVAQRLVLRDLDEPLPEPSAFAAWTVRPVSFAPTPAG
jgi:hypothetical protein